MQSVDSRTAAIAQLQAQRDSERRAMAALHALGQRSRLLMFRMLVRHEPKGLALSAIAQTMNAPQNSISAHLAVLSRAELVTNIRLGRSVIYRAHMDNMNWLLDYLLTDCWNGEVEDLASLLPALEKSSGANA